MELSLKEQENGAISVIISGEFSFSDSSKFREMFKNIEKSCPTHISVDLSACEMIDSAALGMLLLLKEKADQISAEVELKNAKGQVLKVLQLSRFQDLFVMDIPDISAA